MNNSWSRESSMETIILTLENEDENFFVLEGRVQKAGPQLWTGAPPSAAARGPRCVLPPGASSSFLTVSWLRCCCISALESVHIFVRLPLSTHTLARTSFCHGNVSVYIVWAFQKEFVYVCDSLTIILEEIPWVTHQLQLTTNPNWVERNIFHEIWLGVCNWLDILREQP